MLNAFLIHLFWRSMSDMPPFLSHSVAFMTWSRISNVAFGTPGNPFLAFLGVQEALPLSNNGLHSWKNIFQ